MNVLGHGIDIVEVGRIERMLKDHPDRFLERCFTRGEQVYSVDGRRRDEHLAARFAAKEAVLKALGTGWSRGIAWTDIEVVPLPSGQPTIRLHGRAAGIAAELGVARWSLSISHTAEYAVASVLATG
jgi:holo-[acyl-carrier protein] synthase